MRCSADDLQGLEQLCRGVTRPALANVRVQSNVAEQVVLKLKTPWREGTAHLAMSPLEFMQRLAALVRWCHSQICSGDFFIVYVTCGSTAARRFRDQDARQPTLHQTAEQQPFDYSQ